MPGFDVNGIICDLFWRGMWLNIFGGGGRMVPGNGGAFRCLGLIEEIKSPCGYKGFWG